MKTALEVVLLSHIGASWWRHQMETFSALLALCESTGHRWIPLKRPVTQSDVFFDLCLNKWSSKQSRRWFETPSRLLSRHCNVWPCDGIWRYGSCSVVFQVMVCCLVATSHCLKQYQPLRTHLNHKEYIPTKFQSQLRNKNIWKSSFDNVTCLQNLSHFFQLLTRYASVTTNHGPRTIFITRTISCP